MQIMGIVGWKNSGKTTLIVELVRNLTTRGLKVSTIKHAHHDFDIDQAGKDSYLHREAGAADVIISSGKRWAHMHELRGESEIDLADLLAHINGADLVLIEGFKLDSHKKIEVVAPDFDGDLLTLNDPDIVALASDRDDLPGVGVPVLSRSNPVQIADFIIDYLDPARLQREAR